jgi:signal transduction histidine kinase
MIGTIQDVTERKRQEEFRDRFIANAAHELRTPMTTLVGFVEMLARKQGNMPEPQMSVALDAMSRSGDRLTVLINNLLDLSKLQQGELEFELAPVAIEDAISSAREAAPPPEGKTVELDVQGSPIALADRHRLDQILSNLLTNAYRYGGPNIRVEATEQNGAVVLSVADDGPGIEPELVPSLFDPFTRGAASSEVGGSGLGLAIVKMLVDASGGQIWHERATPHGARFNVRLKRPA